MSINKCIIPIVSITVIEILCINVSRFLKYRKCKISLDGMHYREANINFIVLKWGMEARTQGNAVPSPLHILLFFQLEEVRSGNMT